MKNKHPDYIAGWKTIEDWKHVSEQLNAGANAEFWQSVAEEFFLARLNLRYLDPIQILQENGTFQGEGFSIVAIQCTLLEFLESTVQGLEYRFLRGGEVLGPYEYSSSSNLFVNFLTSRIPFSSEFNTNLAHDFYIGVRCGLLHEARTKNGWRIWAKDSADRMVNSGDRIVFRDNFQAALLKFISAYIAELPYNLEYQKAFIRKFDSLCK